MTINCKKVLPDNYREAPFLCLNSANLVKDIKINYL